MTQRARNLVFPLHPHWLFTSYHILPLPPLFVVFHMFTALTAVTRTDATFVCIYLYIDNYELK